MSLVKTFGFKIAILALIVGSFYAVRAVYVPTNRDTHLPPDTVTEFIEEPTDMQLLKETDNFRYYFRDSRDTLAIYDKRNGYTWTTGTDLEFSKDIKDACDDIADEFEDQYLDLDPLLFGDFTFFNGDVTTGLTESSYKVSNEKLYLEVKDLEDGHTEDSVSFAVNDLKLIIGRTYRLSFKMDALADKYVHVILGNVVDELLLVVSPEDADYNEYTYEFTMTENISSTSLEFLVGNVNNDLVETTIYLEDISLVELSGGDVVADSEQIVRGNFDLLESELTVTEEDLLDVCVPIEAKLNTTFTGFANSLLTIEYYDVAKSVKRLSSASRVDVQSELLMVNNDDSHYRLDIDFKKLDIEVSLHIYLDDDGIEFEVRDDEIIIEEDENRTDIFAGIILAPFLGASGGAYEEFDVAELDYADDPTFKYRVPGYTLVPDGSGTLIRFNDNDVKLDYYKGDVYGNDPSLNQRFYDETSDYVPFKQPSMPVFGIAHGNDQAAFVAYATSGDEYMQIVSTPEEQENTYYNFSYPRFTYDTLYLQVYNKSGWGFTTFYEDRNHYDINMRYDFLSGDGSDGPSADYVGMAQRYREYLIENGLLHEMSSTDTDIPIRLDFFMSDVEKSITGFRNQVTTDYKGVDNILEKLIELNITNINSGLLGWNDGGVTLGNPSKTDYHRNIGRERDFRRLISKYNEEGIDISFVSNYYLINEEMMTLRRNAAQHTSTWYSRIETYNYPVSEFYFARPVKSVKWLQDQTSDFDKIDVQSYSVSGITNNLITDYTNDLRRTDSKQQLIDGFASLNQDVLVNAYQPNMFLWQFTDRYIGTPVYGTQYLIETDTVPFLQLVLNNTMELYGPYSNFSFYTDSDVLRMIDYNIYPNFVLTENPAYLLDDTNSRNFYSTEFELYEELIVSIYGDVNNALKHVIGVDWVDRTVYQNGVIINTYANGVEIIINYTDEVVVYGQTIVLPISYEVVGE